MLTCGRGVRKRTRRLEIGPAPNQTAVHVKKQFTDEHRDLLAQVRALEMRRAQGIAAAFLGGAALLSVVCVVRHRTVSEVPIFSPGMESARLLRADDTTPEE